MRILFTISGAIGSKLIRKLTKEPVSHCALQFEAGDYEFVIHSGVSGIEIIPAQTFRNTHVVVFETPIPQARRHLIDLAFYAKRPYDYWAILWLAAYFILGLTPKHNSWALRRAYLCTELITEILYGYSDSVITPYGLYLRLMEEYKRECECCKRSNT